MKLNRYFKIGFIIVGITLGTIFLFGILNLAMKQYSKSHTITTNESTLEKILNIEELHSYEYSYSSWATVYETKYDMETYKKYHNISLILTNDKKAIEKQGPDLEGNFQKYKENLNNRNILYQDLRKQGINFEDYAKKEYQDVDLWNIAQHSAGSKKAKDIEKYYYYTILPARLSILSICDNYNDLCDLEQFLRLSEKKAPVSINTIKYIVAYEGKVRAGIDEKIKIEKSEDGKILIYVPPIKILSVTVDIPPDERNKSVIELTKNTARGNNFFKEATQHCEKDLNEKIKQEAQFLTLAEENLFETIKALIVPFIPNDTEYEIVLKENH